MAAWPKISRGGGYFRKIFGQGGVNQKYPPTPYSRCLVLIKLN